MAKKKRIGHITWITYPNYGTFLQAYALQRVINSLGYHSRIIDDCRFTNLYISPRLWLIKILAMVKHPRSNFLWLKSRYKQLSPFNRFKKRFLKIDSSWSTESSLSKRYDGFICGSDQIWSPLLPSQNNGFYFASFVKANKIAYAPSIGCSSIPCNLQEQYREWLRGFNAICMREKNTSIEISRLLGKDVPTVLDPTLLLTAFDWSNLKNHAAFKTPYILAYFLTYNESYIKYVKKLASDLGYSIVSLGEDSVVKQLSNKKIERVGPDDFVCLVESAECVLTDSYHGTIFSILFNRPFATFKRFKNSDLNNQNSRLENLFTLLDIDHFYSETDANSNQVELIRDFSSINRELDKLRDKSISALKDSLGNI